MITRIFSIVFICAGAVQAQTYFGLGAKGGFGTSLDYVNQRKGNGSVTIKDGWADNVNVVNVLLTTETSYDHWGYMGSFGFRQKGALTEVVGANAAASSDPRLILLLSNDGAAQQRALYSYASADFNLKFYLLSKGIRPYVFLGPRLDARFGEKISYKVNEEAANSSGLSQQQGEALIEQSFNNSLNDRSRFQFGLQAGAGVKFWRMFLEGELYSDVAQLEKYTGASEASRSNQTASVTVGFYFISSQ